MKKIVLFFFLILFLGSTVSPAFSLAQGKQIGLYFFYGSTCPHCKKAEKKLESLKDKYPQLQIKSFEVFGNKKNGDLFLKFLEACGKEREIRVPAMFIGDEVIIGYLSEETTGFQLEKIISQCLKKSCPDPLKKLKECQICECEGEGCKCKTCECQPEEIKKDQIISLPIIGKVDLSKMSLLTLSVTLGALDGLNPCAMWVLLFLIALCLNTRSRKKMWLVGGIFITASGLIYFLLLSAWLNLFLVISYVNLTRIIIGLLSLGMGIWQIKNFITYHPGVCKIIGLKPKIEEKLRQRAERIVASPFTWAMVGSLIILAFGVNLVEFFCSAGLPAIFTRILSLNHINTLTRYLYLLLYTFVFMLDDLIIFSLTVITLSRIGFTNKYNYWATLFGGLLIFILGLLLIFKPEFLIFG